MSEQIKAIRFDVEDIGKHVKGSKKRFAWMFSLNNRNHTIVVDFSFISGKVKVTVDKKVLLQNELPPNASFQHPFTLSGYALNILQQGQTFQLRINNKVFSHLYNQEKTNTQFKNYEDEIKDIKVDQKKFTNESKTVKLNIGAFDGMKKKPKGNLQTDDWNNFGGNNMGFPSYFGQATTAKVAKVEPKVINSSLLDQSEEVKKETQTISKDLFQLDEPQPVRKTEEKDPIDFFSESPKKSTSPSEQHISQTKNQKVQKQDFNTMQNLFATKQVQPNNYAAIDFFNEQPQKQILTTASHQQFQSPLGDFNTMQNLFATNYNNIGSLPTSGLNSVQLNSLNGSALNPNHTASSAIPINQLYSANIPNLQDFNTMQNLFQTQNSQIKPTPPYYQTNSPAVQIASLPYNYNSQNNPASNIQNINYQDFNTMQNLFQTQSKPVNQNVSKSVVDPFSILSDSLIQKETSKPNINVNVSSQQMKMMNTYSGNYNQIPNPSNFGTMANQTSISSLDFFGPSASTPTTTTNMKKNKQSQDLI